MNRERRRRLMLIGGTVGALVGGLIGYLFGMFVFPAMDLADTFHVTDPMPTAMLFGWLLTFGGLLGGGRWGKEYSDKLNKRELQRLRREKYANVIAAYEDEKARDPELARLAERGQRKGRR
jgi:hypothetical protein